MNQDHGAVCFRAVYYAMTVAHFTKPDQSSVALENSLIVLTNANQVGMHCH